MKNLLFGLTLLLSAATAQADAVSDFTRYIDAASSISGQFSQEGKAASKKVSGSFMIARPGKFRWAIEKPYEQLIVSDGSQVSLYDKDLKQVTVRPLNDALSATPVALLLGGDLLRQFDLKDIGSKDGMRWLEALPKNKDMQFKRLTLGLLAGVPSQIVLTDAFEKTTTITLLDVSNRTAVSAETFRFVPPVGVDVLQQ